MNVWEKRRSFALFADGVTSMSSEELEKYGIRVIGSFVRIDDEKPCLMQDGDSPDDFYGKITAATEIRTSSASIQNIIDELKPRLEEGLDVLYVGMSEGISSGTANSVHVAIADLKELYPERRIEWIDSHCMSWGMGLLLQEALKHDESYGGVKQFILRERDFVAHLFTFSDLRHARMSGKINALEAFVGSILNIQPFLELVYQGKLRVLKSTSKVRGKLRIEEDGTITHDKVADMIVKRTISDLREPNGRVIVTYGASDDAQARAKRIARLLREALPEAQVEIGRVTPLIGCHVGPTVVSIHFFSRFRDTPPC